MIMWQTYIYRDTEIEAIQFTNENKEQVLNIVRDIQSNVSASGNYRRPSICIPTSIPCHSQYCQVGDWIIKLPHPVGWNKIGVVESGMFDFAFKPLNRPDPA